MKTSITLKLDSNLVREARALAAEEGTSHIAMLAAHLGGSSEREKSIGRRGAESWRASGPALISTGRRRAAGTSCIRR